MSRPSWIPAKSPAPISKYVSLGCANPMRIVFRARSISNTGSESIDMRSSSSRPSARTSAPRPAEMGKVISRSAHLASFAYASSSVNANGAPSNVNVTKPEVTKIRLPLWRHPPLADRIAFTSAVLAFALYTRLYSALRYVAAPAIGPIRSLSSTSRASLSRGIVEVKDHVVFLAVDDLEDVILPILRDVLRDLDRTFSALRISRTRAGHDCLRQN